jgi:hypothetical protein
MAASLAESSAHKKLSWREALDLVKDLPDSDAHKLLSMSAGLISKTELSKRPFLQLSYQYGERIVDKGD